MQRAKERPNLVHWRDELVAITKDSTEDFEDATLSVELMRVRCDVCYHEKSVSLDCCRKRAEFEMCVPFVFFFCMIPEPSCRWRRRTCVLSCETS